MKAYLFYMLILLLFLFTGEQVKAQILPFDSVKQAIIRQNPELKMYVNQAKAYEAMAEGATAWEAPQIGAGFFMTPYKTSFWKDREEMVNDMPVMMPGMGNFMIQGKQMITNPGKLKANQRYQKAMSTVEEEKSKSAANDLLFQAKTGYFEIQIIDRKLLILKEAQNTLQTMIQLGEKKIAYSQESLSNIYKARSQAALLQKDQWMMEGERKQKHYLLNGLMNRPKEQTIQPDTFFTIHNYEQAPVDSGTVLQNRSDIKAMEQNIRVMQLKQKTELIKSRPDFGIEYGHMFAFGSNPNQFTLMGMMTIPIAPWSSKMYKSAAKANQFEIEAMRNQKAAMVIETIGMAEGMKSEINSAKYQLKLYKEMILPSLQKAYDVAMLAYANNTGELFMALDARMGLQMAQMQYWDTMLNLLKLEAEYEKQLQIF